MNFIDTHCHLYLDDFKNDIDEVVKRATESGVKKFYLPAIDSSETGNMLLLESRYPHLFYPMTGLHPCSVKENYETELGSVFASLAKRSFCAIGEIGLDFYWDTSFTSQQYLAFEIQMQWAFEKKLPIIIHTRNAMQQTIDTVKPFAEKGLKGIFHCFGDSYEFAKQIIDMDFLLGIGGVATYKKAGLETVLPNIGMQHIVLETDAPYLTPVPHRGKRNESSYIVFVAGRIAEIMKISIEDVAAITTANAEKIFAN